MPELPRPYNYFTDDWRSYVAYMWLQIAGDNLNLF